MATIPGVKVTIGGTELEVPPMPYSAVRRFSVDGTFAKADKLTDQASWGPDTVDAIHRIVLAAIKRNYPDMNEAGLEALLDKEENWGAALGKLLLAVRGITFKPKPEDAKGEQ